MVKNKPKSKLVFLQFHGLVYRELLQRWLDCHPRTFWWRSGNIGDETETITMSECGWRRFCSDYGYDYKSL